MASRLPLLRTISKLLKPPPFSLVRSSRDSRARLLLQQASRPNDSPWSMASSRSFCSGPLNLPHDSQGPATIDYGSVLQEDEFHRLANSTINDRQEKLDEYGDIVQINGFSTDYWTPNRQIWLSSPASGPSRFDWDHNAQAWVY